MAKQILIVEDEPNIVMPIQFLSRYRNEARTNLGGELPTCILSIYTAGS